MANTKIRDLKIFEFNRALSYVSEIIEIERKLQKLQKERELLNEEYSVWKEEAAETKEDLEDIEQITENIKEKCEEVMIMKADLQKYHYELKYLLFKILEYVTEDDNEDFELTKQEIQKSFLEEYVYLLSEPVLDDSPIIIKRLFKDKADLAILIFESYGNEREELLRDIVNAESDDYLPQCFEDYFPQ